MTNYGALAILALPKLSRLQRDLLIALETVTPREGGWRPIGVELLASQAGMSVHTAAKARDELAAAGLIDYRRGTGPGHPSLYRLTFDLSNPGKNATVNRGKNARINPGKKGSGTLAKAPQNPGSRNAATSANASGALEPIALESSALPGTPSPRTILRGLLDHETDDEIDFIHATLLADPNHRSDLASYLLGQIAKDNGKSLIAWAHRRLGIDDRPLCDDPDCDHGWINVTDSSVKKCPNRHQGPA